MPACRFALNYLSVQRPRFARTYILAIINGREYIDVCSEYLMENAHGPEGLNMKCNQARFTTSPLFRGPSLDWISVRNDWPHPRAQGCVD